MKETISIFWFRQDLRLSDNPGLVQAVKLGKVLPIYILDNLSPSPFKIGDASKVYLHHSLMSLNNSLDGALNFYIGNPQEIISKLIKKYTIENLFLNRCYEPWRVSNDQVVEKMLSDLKINYTAFDGSYLWTPESITKEDGSYYKVFGAYKRKAYSFKPRKHVSKPENIVVMKDHDNTTTLDDFQLILKNPSLDKIIEHCTFGEAAAQKKLHTFLQRGLSGYKEGRDYPSHDQTSRLSANLHFGEISPHQIWDSVQNVARLDIPEQDVSHFFSEMVWREFSCYLLMHFKGLPSENFQNKFDVFPWKYNEHLLHAWKTGTTGIPLVDAGMRELWQTGYMHNRVRMVVASFLVKNLMIHWHHGRDWFWECLVDADLANNSASWQWVAGCGVDAAPYFRIFNPVIQGEKFDKDGEYTKKFIPELAKLPNKYLFKPWTAPENILKTAGIVLGVTYPKPIIDLAVSRNKALEAYKTL